jgi:hypothetical protein
MSVCSETRTSPRLISHSRDILLIVSQFLNVLCELSIRNCEPAIICQIFRITDNQRWNHWILFHISITNLQEIFMKVRIWFTFCWSFQMNQSDYHSMEVSIPGFLTLKSNFVCIAAQERKNERMKEWKGWEISWAESKIANIRIHFPNDLSDRNANFIWERLSTSMIWLKEICESVPLLSSNFHISDMNQNYPNFSSPVSLQKVDLSQNVPPHTTF